MHETDLFTLLRNSTDLAEVSDDSLVELIRIGTVQNPPLGSEILEQGKASGQVWILLSGEFEVFVDGELVNRISTPGEIVGQISAISLIPATATVRIAAPSHCLAIAYQSLHPLSVAHPDLAAALLRSMAKYRDAK